MPIDANRGIASGDDGLFRPLILRSPPRKWKDSDWGDKSYLKSRVRLAGKSCSTVRNCHPGKDAGSQYTVLFVEAEKPRLWFTLVAVPL